MVALTQNTVIGFGDGQAGNGQVTQRTLVFPADENLRHRAVAAHRQSGNRTITTTYVQRNVVKAGFTAADHLAALLQDKAPAPVAFQGTGNRQRFSRRQRNRRIDIVANHTRWHVDGVGLREGLIERADPVAIVHVVTYVHCRALLGGTRAGC